MLDKLSSDIGLGRVVFRLFDGVPALQYALSLYENKQLKVSNTSEGLFLIVAIYLYLGPLPLIFF